MDELELKLTGLKALADSYNAKLRDIYLVALEITGVRDEARDSGVVSDFIYAESLATVRGLIEATESYRRGTTLT